MVMMFLAVHAHQANEQRLLDWLLGAANTVLGAVIMLITGEQKKTAVTTDVTEPEPEKK